MRRAPVSCRSARDRWRTEFDARKSRSGFKRRIAGGAPQLLATEKKFACATSSVRGAAIFRWERVANDCLFDGPNGKQGLVQSFESRSQLVIYHFMFAPDWSAGCLHCSFWADNFKPGCAIATITATDDNYFEARLEASVRPNALL
ncbi:MAG: DUF899 family protein [Candidatus Binataceae bacterium]